VQDTTTRRRITFWRLISFIVAASLPFIVMGLIIHTESRRQANADAMTVSEIILSQTETVIAQSVNTASMLLPMAGETCAQAEPTLRQLSSLRPYFRVLALIQNDSVYCSSAFGEVSTPLHILIPTLTTLPNGLSLEMVRGTPKASERPALMVTLGSSSGRGVLIVVDGQYLLDLQAAASYNNLYAVSVKIGNAPPLGANLGPAPQGVARQAGNQRLGSSTYPVVVNSRVNESQLGTYSGVLWRNYLPFMLLASPLLVYAVHRYYKRQFSLGMELRKAIRANEFHVVYQPLVDILTGDCVGVEALLRWKHPLFGSVVPDIFISVAEETGMIVPLTRHLFFLVARDWSKGALPEDFHLSLNIAGEHLEGAEIIEDVALLQRNLGARQPKLLLEITERKVVPGNQHVLDNIRALQTKGIKIAIDDFGTGHSSLSYLEQFSVDYLKIDRGFIASINTDAVSAPVLDMIIALGIRLELTLVAEGVETANQVEYLRAKGVRLAQGYFFSPPLSIDALKSWLQAQSQIVSSSLPLFVTESRTALSSERSSPSR
jgi:sensor c-di-GMP phosphodiesterase-like protein